jgi:hypothetical protein
MPAASLAAAKPHKRDSQVLKVRVPKPGGVTLALFVAKAKRGAKTEGVVTKAKLVNRAKLPRSVVVIGDVGRLKGHHEVVVLGVMVVNRKAPGAARSARAVTADFNIATGLKWAPLRYTFPIGIGSEIANGAAPMPGMWYGGAGELYGNHWQTTSLDNYIAFFFTEQIGFQLALDLGRATGASSPPAGFVMNFAHAIGAGDTAATGNFFSVINGSPLMPPTMGPPTPTPTFAVKVFGDWHHNAPGDSSLVTCINTDPVPGAPYTLTVTKPDGSTGTQSGNLDSAGKATVTSPINAYGSYTQTVSVTSGGTTKTAMTSTTVTSTQHPGTC